MSKLRTAVCITGRLDLLEITANNLKRNVLNQLDNPDIFIYYSEMGERKIFYRGIYNTSVDIFKKLISFFYFNKKKSAKKNLDIKKIYEYLPYKEIIVTNDKYLSDISDINVRNFGKGKESYLQMIYALFQCNKMIKKYEQKNNIKYDFKLRLRADVLFIKPIPNIYSLPSNKITIPLFHNERDGCGEFGKFADKKCIHDRFAVGPSSKMDILLNQYINIKGIKNCKYFTHAEHLLYHYLDWNNLSFKKNIIEKNNDILFLRIRRNEYNNFEIFPSDCGDSKRRPNDKKNCINCDKFLKDWKKTGISQLI